MGKAISSLSANAISAKAHAMYAELLTEADYEALAACRTVTEAAGYLRTHTAYAQVFAALPNGKVHRVRVEAAVNRQMQERIASLCSFARSLGQELHRIFLLRADIDCILLCADYLDSDSVGEYAVHLPPFFRDNTEIDVTVLERARCPEDLWQGLRGTRYEPLVEKVENGVVGFSVPTLENILYEYLYTQAVEIINKNFSGHERAQLLDFFRMRADMKTIESIYRQKQYFRADLIPQNGSFFSSKVTSFTPRELEEMLHAETADAVLDTVRKTRYGKYLPQTDGIIERKTQLLQLRINQKNMRYSTCPQLVMLSFIGIIENEARNVTHIIEGIRYHLPPAEISAHLIKMEE
ncbi:MAG: V0D/AC39 family V-type ATPase subunit [Candidatus Fimenecus sp.]